MTRPGSGTRVCGSAASEAAGSASSRRALCVSSLGTPFPGREGRAGFTLIEVLAAVAILGIWFTVIATGASQGLRAEGQSQRRLEASLLADQILADFEAPLLIGIAPALQNEESERGPFRVRIEVEPFELSFGPSDAGDEAAPAQPRGAPRPAAARASLLGGGGPSAPSPLRRLHVVVSWTDGVNERSVHRTSFAFDRVAALPLLEALSPEQAGLSQRARDREAAGNGRATDSAGRPLR